MPNSPHPSPLLDDLPSLLRERAVLLNSRPVNTEAEFVLCWLHHAIRDHDNPALDTAVALGNQLAKPVLVYQGLGGNHRFNSDRHHTFILQGANDLAAGLRSRGIAYALHVPTDPNQPSPLRKLLERACALVTEDFPAPPFPQWSRAWATRSPVVMIAVDSACLMPMRLVRTRHTRAFKFREAAQREWRSRMRESWSNVSPTVPSLPVTEQSLGFQPTDPTTIDLTALCAQCEIDHDVTPVDHLIGGSVAGYQRWETFKTHHLRTYDKRRNNALDPDGVSGLSPYLHHGQISIFRIAREANQVGGSGADKFLDELLVWRELAHNFCAHTDHRQLETLQAIPPWAQQTLEDHRHDQRNHGAASYTSAQLASGQTGDRLWDAAQKSLLLNGELHNNLRMTWGKAVVQWSPTPEQALATLIDLNHRYALDGNDPNSYGGLLWCLGQFDRPFTPEVPVLGTIRPRDTATHASRLDPDAYLRIVTARSIPSTVRTSPQTVQATLFDDND